MKLPSTSAYVREAALVIGGAVLAALIIGMVPGLRDWINRQWKPDRGCACGGNSSPHAD